MSFHSLPYLDLPRISMGKLVNTNTFELSKISKTKVVSCENYLILVSYPQHHHHIENGCFDYVGLAFQLKLWQKEH